MHAFMPDSQRLLMIDALRGFALSALFLLHVIDYFELFWLDPERNALHSFLHLLVSGKAYSIFALMFGLSFFLMMDSQAKKGIDFSGRFLWRMGLLLALGLLHGLLFVGDILQILAIVGLLLVALNRLPTKALAISGGVLLLQPDLLFMLWRVASDPAANVPPLHIQFKGLSVYATGTLGDVLGYNATAGTLRKWIYMFESGRLIQIIGLFLIGLVLGRIGFFHRPEAFTRQRRAAMAACAAALIAFYLGESALRHLIHSTPDHRLVNYYRESILILYRVDLMMALYVLGFIELWQWSRARLALSFLAAPGRMTLTLYVGQSLIFVPLFYGFGLDLHRHINTPIAFAFAVTGIAAQIAFARLWFTKFHYGPLEWAWRAATYLNPRIPLRKTPPSSRH